ncbi:Uncharacterised protein [uncultured archaeon]|nr:Uncharacterised protein [uncultured archaeon]
MGVLHVRIHDKETNILNQNRRLANLLKVQILFIPTYILVHFDAPEYRFLLLRLLFSYSFSVLFMSEFEKYLDNKFDIPTYKRGLIEYVLSNLTALIMFLIIELIVDSNFFIFSALVLLIFVHIYVISLIFQFKGYKGSRKHKRAYHKS